MKINLGNGILIEDVTVEDIREIIKSKSKPEVKAARASLVKSEHRTLKSTCNNKLNDRQAEICERYFKLNHKQSDLAEDYGVVVGSIIHCLKTYGVKLGYINEKRHYSKTNKEFWNI